MVSILYKLNYLVDCNSCALTGPFCSSFSIPSAKHWKTFDFCQNEDENCGICGQLLQKTTWYCTTFFFFYNYIPAVPSQKVDESIHSFEKLGQDKSQEIFDARRTRCWQPWTRKKIQIWILQQWDTKIAVSSAQLRAKALFIESNFKEGTNKKLSHSVHPFLAR